MLTGDMLRRSAGRFPAKTAVACGDRRISYAALDAAANRLANALLGPGALPSQGKVGIMSRNGCDYAIAFFGVARSGGVLVNISVLYAPDELAYVLQKADVEILLCEDVWRDKLAAVRDRLPKLRQVYIIGAPAAGEQGLDRLLQAGAETPPPLTLDENAPFCMTYTGGTTGRPKGVLASHRARAITAHTVMVEEAIDERDVVAVVTPMFHVAALNIMFQPAILAGATVVLLPQWSAEAFVALVQTHGVTAAFMVPTQAIALVTMPDLDAGRLASFRKLSFAGAPMPDWTQRSLMEKLPWLRLTQIYGQSEMGVIAVLRHWYLPNKLGAVGRMPYNVDVAVVNAVGRPVAPGEIGEVVSRGDNLMLEYYGEPEQTAAFYRLGDGWGWSGDLATVDDEGFITLVDRSKDMIISGGENIYPKEIETVLFLLPEVQECAVFGVPDEKFGELPAAYIQLRAGASLSEQAVIAHCEAQLARFKRPRLIRFVADFPKTPIGKIQKTILREPYWTNREKKI